MGVDFKTFSQLVYQNTNASLQFLTATDSNRKKFLIDLLHLEEYLELFEIFKAASRDSDTLITGASAKIATIDRWLTNNKLTDSNILPIVNIEIDTEEDEKQLSILLSEIRNISENNKKIIKNNGLIDVLKSLDLQKAVQEAPGDKVPVAEHKEALYVLKAKRLQAIKALEKITKLKTKKKELNKKGNAKQKKKNIQEK